MKSLAIPAPAEICVGRVAMIWSMVMLATDLRSLIPYVQWAFTAAVAAIAVPYLIRHWRRVTFPGRVPAWLFVVAICIPVAYGAKVIYSFAEAVKLMVILIVALPLFLAHTNLALWAFRGFIANVWVNLALLAGGLLGMRSGGEMLMGRWGTMLSWPGGLWRVSITVWVFAAYLFVVKRSKLHLCLWLASTCLVYVDGTRTGILLLVAGVLYLIIILMLEPRRIKRSVAVTAAAAALLLAAAGYMVAANSTDQGGLGRVSDLSSALQAGGLGGLQAADVVRYQMLQDVVDAIQEHPVFGTGIQTTVSETIIGPMPIHMTYLQVWADMGVLGLIAYMWLVWGWLVWTPRVIRRIRSTADPVQRAVYYNALFVLIVYGFTGFLHPLSTEFSEWIIFIVPYALLWEVAHLPVLPNATVFKNGSKAYA
jgi:O-antigen ligase